MKRKIMRYLSVGEIWGKWLVIALFLLGCSGGGGGPSIPSSAGAEQLPEDTSTVTYLMLEDYGGRGDGLTDNTAALNAAVADLAVHRIRTIRLKAGTYRFNTKPATFGIGVIIIGQGMSSTSLVRGYSASGPDEGFLTWYGPSSNGGGLEHCLVRADAGTTSGSMLKFATGENEIAGYHYIDHVVVTYSAGAEYERTLLVDGLLNAVNGSQGLRDFYCGRAFLFKSPAGSEAMRFINATNLITVGLWTNGSVIVTGGGTATTNTTDARLDLISLGLLFVSNSTKVVATGLVDSLIFSSGTSDCFYGGASSSHSDYGVNNRIL